MRQRGRIKSEILRQQRDFSIKNTRYISRKRLLILQQQVCITVFEKQTLVSTLTSCPPCAFLAFENVPTQAVWSWQMFYKVGTSSLCEPQRDAKHALWVRNTMLISGGVWDENTLNILIQWRNISCWHVRSFPLAPRCAGAFHTSIRFNHRYPAVGI